MVAVSCYIQKLASTFYPTGLHGSCWLTELTATTMASYSYIVNQPPIWLQSHAVTVNGQHDLLWVCPCG